MRIVAFLICSIAAVALAQPEPTAEPDRVVIPRLTVIRLDGQTIEGGVEGPAGSVIFARERTRFGNFVQVRQSFRAELLRSSADL